MKNMKNMKQTCLILVILVGFFMSSKSHNYFLTRISSSIEMKPFSTGYVTPSGDTIIPIGKYCYCYTQKFDKIAIVMPKANSAYYAIDRTEKILFEVVNIDNGPDYVKDGLFRIRKNGKIGYANLDGEIVIEPVYVSALPFNGGYAAVCIGGKTISRNEVSFNEGGKWGYIDKSGNEVIRPQYDKAWNVKNGKAMVEKDNKKYRIEIK